MIKAAIAPLLTKYVQKIEVAGPGFLNFYLSTEELSKGMQKVLDGQEKIAPTPKYSDKKVMVEFTDPNPFKELHIGHLFSNAVGESLSRLIASQGATVRRVCYQGDVGLHVAKAIFGMQKMMNDKGLMIKDLEGKPLVERARFLGESYAMGAKAYEEDEAAKAEMNGLNKKIYDRTDPEINELYDKGRKWSLEQFETIYKRLGTKFDGYYFESEVGKYGIEFVRAHIGSVFEESEGAVIFPGKKHGLHNRVFINSLGLPTYEAKELGLAPTKYKDWQYDESIIVTGNEINDYFRVLLKALSLINPELASKTVHIGHGMLKLKGGKMSSRLGNVLLGEWLLDEAKRQISAQYADMDEATAEMVAVAAVKYSLLKSGIGKDVVFDFDESISFEGNSGPYLQYTYARTRSVLSKAQNTVESSMQNVESMEKEELELLRKLYHFEGIVEQSAADLAPHTLATYLFELAQLFNNFYQKHKIIGSEQEVLRLALTEATGSVIKKGLDLLGIQSPEHM